MQMTRGSSMERVARRTIPRYISGMLHYFKFRQELFDPAPAKDVYIKRGAGKGWPEECPPIRAANSFGFDLLANFDLAFIRARARNGWKVKKDILIDSDFDYSARDDAPGQPLVQQYAWFWDKGQKIPHVITDNVYEQIKNQVKVSSFLFLKTDPNELLMMTDIPNVARPWRAITALIDTDWYPASYPWHVVLELDPAQKRIDIKKGDPLCRVIPVRRDTYFAGQMTPVEFDAFFDRGQRWLATHGRFEHEEAGGAAGAGGAGATTTNGVADITRTYVRQQTKSKFIVLD